MRTFGRILNIAGGFLFGNGLVHVIQGHPTGWITMALSLVTVACGVSILVLSEKPKPHRTVAIRNGVKDERTYTDGRTSLVVTGMPKDRADAMARKMGLPVEEDAPADPADTTPTTRKPKLF